ncbi:MAG: hypothetical protein GY820_34670 [Gammaproteobacteria bacterium]|nr:hypothetical protein [Gammaproteobacteria bacterium]
MTNHKVMLCKNGPPLNEGTVEKQQVHNMPKIGQNQNGQKLHRNYGRANYNSRFPLHGNQSWQTPLKVGPVGNPFASDHFSRNFRNVHRGFQMRSEPPRNWFNQNVSFVPQNSRVWQNSNMRNFEQNWFIQEKIAHLENVIFCTLSEVNRLRNLC